MCSDHSYYLFSYFDQFRPFFILLETIKRVLSDHHFKGQNSNSPDVSRRPTIHPLSILRRQILQGAYDLFVCRLVFVGLVG